MFIRGRSTFASFDPSYLHIDKLHLQIDRALNS